MENRGRREDVLVSVCLTEVARTSVAYDAILKFSELLESRFRFREIIIVTKVSEREHFESLLQNVGNLRLLFIRDGLSSYEERVIAASEAIGDVVLITGAEQLGSFDQIMMIETAGDRGSIVVGYRKDPRGIYRGLEFLLSGFGRAAGFRVGWQISPTLAIPRSLLNQLLDFSDPDLALRFIPRDPAFPIIPHFDRHKSASPSAYRNLFERLVITKKLTVHMAPAVLNLVSISSALLTFLGCGYTLYIVYVWFFAPSIEPGWFTISAMLSLTAVFLGISIFGLSVGVQRLISLLKRGRTDNVSGEISRVDLFDQVASELNIEYDKQNI